MNPSGKIDELQQKIFELSADIGASMHQLRALQAELDRLKKATGYETAAKPVISENPGTNMSASSNTSSSKGIENFIGLRVMHLVGIVVLVTGISIGVKYAIDRQLISEGMRILLAYAAGILLFILSVRLKKQYQLFSAILFSGSMASVYFTTYAASVYYQFIPPILAFVLMLALTVYTALMALQYNRKEIAIIGMVGAYGIPFLISANAERTDVFFSYILLINIGVVFLSFKRGWKLMSQLALLITWMLFIGWGFLRFVPSQQAVAIVFMLLYYLLFMASALGFRIKNNTALTGGDIQQVIFNNAALYLAAIIVFGDGKLEAALATVTGCMFLLTALLALLAWKILSSETLLQRTLIGQALIFVLLWIAFQWDGLTVTLLWVAVSVLLFVWGVLTQMSWARLASVVLIGITLLKLLLFDSLRFSTIQKISSYIIIGILLLLFSFYYQKLGLSKKQDNES